MSNTNIAVAEILEAAATDWRLCEKRAPLVRNYFRDEIVDFRDKALKARGAYKQPFMNEPCAFIAEVCDKAADLFQAELDAMDRAAEELRK